MNKKFELVVCISLKKQVLQQEQDELYIHILAYFSHTMYCIPQGNATWTICTIHYNNTQRCLSTLYMLADLVL